MQLSETDFFAQQLIELSDDAAFMRAFHEDPVVALLEKGYQLSREGERITDRLRSKPVTNDRELLREISKSHLWQKAIW